MEKANTSMIKQKMKDILFLTISRAKAFTVCYKISIDLQLIIL
jgi:hypothetical protein